MKNETVMMILDAVMTTELPAIRAEEKKKELKAAIEKRLEEVLREIYAQVGVIALDPNFCVDAALVDRDGHVEPGEDAPMTDAEMLRGMLSWINIWDIPLAVIESWTEAQRNGVADYIRAVQMKAPDNDDVVVPPVPELLKQYGRNR